MSSWTAMIMLNAIALIAILLADRELSKALRETDKLSSERSSARAFPSAVFDGQP